MRPFARPFHVAGTTAATSAPEATPRDDRHRPVHHPHRRAVRVAADVPLALARQALPRVHHLVPGLPLHPGRGRSSSCFGVTAMEPAGTSSGCLAGGYVVLDAVRVLAATGIVFHFEPEEGLGARLHWIIHGVHHDHPNDPKRLVMPPAVSVPLAGAHVSACSCWSSARRPRTWRFTASFLAGYLVYDGSCTTTCTTRARAPRWAAGCASCTCATTSRTTPSATASAPPGGTASFAPRTASAASSRPAALGQLVRRAALLAGRDRGSAQRGRGRRGRRRAAGAGRTVRVAGSGHSFSDLVCTDGHLLTLSEMAERPRRRPVDGPRARPGRPSRCTRSAMRSPGWGWRSRTRATSTPRRSRARWPPAPTGPAPATRTSLAGRRDAAGDGRRRGRRARPVRRRRGCAPHG